MDFTQGEKTHHTVLLRRTFIEVVDCSPDASCSRRRLRHKTDSALLVQSAFSSDCISEISTDDEEGEEEEAAVCHQVSTASEASTFPSTAGPCEQTPFAANHAGDDASAEPESPVFCLPAFRCREDDRFQDSFDVTTPGANPAAGLCCAAEDLPCQIQGTASSASEISHNRVHERPTGTGAIPGEETRRIVVHKTFIEVVDCSPDISCGRRPLRHKTDSAILVQSAFSSDYMSDVSTDDEGAAMSHQLSMKSEMSTSAANDAQDDASPESPEPETPEFWPPAYQGQGRDTSRVQDSFGVTTPSANPAAAVRCTAEDSPSESHATASESHSAASSAEEVSHNSSAEEVSHNGSFQRPAHVRVGEAHCVGTEMKPEANNLSRTVPEAQPQARLPHSPRPQALVAVLLPVVFPPLVAPHSTLAATGAAQAQAGEVSQHGDWPCADQHSGPVATDDKTTLVLRNIPNNYTRDTFLALLRQLGLRPLFDFLYLPVDFRTGAGLGYAYLNAVSGTAAQRIWRVMDCFTRWKMPSKKCCRVSWSDPHQGLQANVERYRNSPLMHESVPDSYKPILLSDGQRVAYPAATKHVRAPRLRKSGQCRDSNVF